MPTNKPRFTITMDESLFQQIEEFRFKHRYKNQTQAVLALIENGIDDLLQQSDEPKTPNLSSLTPEELQLVEDYRSMEPDGQAYIRQTVRIAKPMYSKTPVVVAVSESPPPDRESDPPPVLGVSVADLTPEEAARYNYEVDCYKQETLAAIVGNRQQLSSFDCFASDTDKSKTG